MKNPFAAPKTYKALDDEIVRLTTALSGMSEDDPRYKEISINLRTVCEARGIKAERGSFSYDVLLGIVGNLAIALLVLNFEKTGAITSKAFGFIGRGKG